MLHLLQIDVLFSVLNPSAFTNTQNTSQLVSILFDEDEIKTRVGYTVGVSKPEEESGQIRG